MTDVLTYCPDCSERLRFDHITNTLYCMECEWAVTLSHLTAAKMSAITSVAVIAGHSRSRALAVIKG